MKLRMQEDRGKLILKDFEGPPPCKYNRTELNAM